VSGVTPSVEIGRSHTHPLESLKSLQALGELGELEELEELRGWGAF
jgi:hypothetical protein